MNAQPATRKVQFSLAVTFGVVLTTVCVYALAASTSEGFRIWALTTLLNVAYAAANAANGMRSCPRGLQLFDGFTGGPLVSSRHFLPNGLAVGLYFAWWSALIGSTTAAAARVGGKSPLLFSEVAGPLVGMHVGVLAFVEGFCRKVTGDDAVHGRNGLSYVFLGINYLACLATFVVARIFRP